MFTGWHSCWLGGWNPGRDTSHENSSHPRHQGWVHHISRRYTEFQPSLELTNLKPPENVVTRSFNYSETETGTRIQHFSGWQLIASFPGTQKKLVDNRTKVCFLGKRHSLETTCSVLRFISRYIQLPEGIEQRDIEQNTNCTWTGTSMQRVYDVTIYEHGRHGIPWRLSTCANSVYRALFLLPLHAWERG